MNDTIMASVAALKSTKQNTSYSLYTGFRSVRSRDPLVHAAQRLTKLSESSETENVRLETDVAAFFRTHSDDRDRHINAILRQYIKDHR